MIPNEILLDFWPMAVLNFASQEWKRQEGGRGWNAGNGSEDRSRTQLGTKTQDLDLHVR